MESRGAFAADSVAARGWPSGVESHRCMRAVAFHKTGSQTRWGGGYDPHKPLEGRPLIVSLEVFGDADVALAGVGQQGHDRFPWAHFLRDLPRGYDIAAR